MGYWKKPERHHHCKKECKPYIQLYSTQTQTLSEGSVVQFNECGPECGFEECRNDLIVQHEGVYFATFVVDLDSESFVITVNGVPQNNTRLGHALLCLKCGDKIRVLAVDGITILRASLTIFKVN